jgi:hypothetical protein
MDMVVEYLSLFNLLMSFREQSVDNPRLQKCITESELFLY